MPRTSDSPDRVVTGLLRWRSFASSIQVNWAGRRRTWEDHIKGAGYVDEQRLVQPIVFPAFAQQLLGYDPNIDLAAEFQLRLTAAAAKAAAGSGTIVPSPTPPDSAAWPI